MTEPPKPSSRKPGPLAVTTAEGAATDGRAMVDRWLDAQGIPELRDLLLENLRTRLSAEIDKLGAAVSARDCEAIARLAHAIKGWSGSFKMIEIATLVTRMDDEIRRLSPEMESVRTLMTELHQVVSRIPHKYLQGVPGGSPLEIEKKTSRDSNTPRVLLVEDDVVNRRLIQFLLTRAGIEPDLAENGQIALDLLRSRPYDLVLLDMEMPVLDGWGTIAEIRKDEHLRALRVVALTAHTSDDSARRCLDSGCDDFLGKPVDPDLLTQKIGGA